MHLRKLLFTGFAIAFSGLSGCDEPENLPRTEQTAYFDVPGFINSQINRLEKEPVNLQKTVGLESKKQETQTINKPDWETELALFREIDLNKKALEGSYTQTKTVLPEGEKLLYTLNADVSAPIVSLEVWKNKQGQVKWLQAVYEQKNTLFYNREIRTLETNGQEQIKAYQISGVQKVLLFDSLAYQVASKLP